MKRVTFVALLLLAATNVAGADFELGIRHVNTGFLGDSGDLDVVMSRGFGATAEAFWTRRLSTELAVTLINPAAEQNGVDLGTLGLQTWSLTARYHLRPDATLSPYAGGGAALAILGNLDDQFGEAVQFDFDRELVPLAELGLRYRVRPSIALDATISYMPLEATPHGTSSDPRVALGSSVSLDPVTVSISAAWRF
ncbi:MAG TPA: OmpW family outer membrane protein [Thermoanaerobaculia bacterium]|jgi:outer membrane protein W